MTHTTKLPIYSRAIKDIDWHEEVLSVWHNNTGQYDYYDVPEPVYDLFEKSSSKGKFFNANIRGQYPYLRVTPVKPKAGKTKP